MKTKLSIYQFLIVAGLLIVAGGCKKTISGCNDPTAYNYNAIANENDGSCLYHTIGESYGGGTIFFVDNSGQHGLIAAPTDQSTGINWGNNSITTTATGTSGQANTNFIIAALGPGNYAAYLCDTLVLGSYSDWFLPSYVEIQKLCTQKQAGTVIGFANERYWSSTEYAQFGALGFNFAGCLTAGEDKSSAMRVRAVRAF